MSASTSAYDQVAYPSYPFAISHPDRLAIAAHLVGIQAADVATCRVLELGCGAGGNILPLADSFPDSQFVGVDFSSQQIGVARKISDAVGLTNLEFLDRDILNLEQSLGAFDYIICHGVFSWTTSEVREKILSLCSSNLSPNGVALINYNTYPGWHLHNWVRDMIRTRALTFEGSAAQIREARLILDILIETFKPQHSPHHGLLLRELENIKRYSDEYLFHAILNFQNQPFYLHEFVASCEPHSLQYIGDADPTLSWSGTVPQHTAEQLASLCKDQIEREQHLDFITNTTSRRSLVCLESVTTRANKQSERFSRTHVSAPLRFEADAQDQNVATFQTAGGRRITTRNAGLRAVLLAISKAWPNSIPYRSLAKASNFPLATWESDLMHCQAAGIIEMSLSPSRCTTTLAERPATTRLARWQATNHGFVANLRHQAVQLEPDQRQLLQQLDGTRTLSELAATAGTEEAAVEQQLDQIARHSLLMGSGEA